MSATSFGGSFELVRNDDAKTRQIFQDRLIQAAIESQFPWLKYTPFAPRQHSHDMDRMIEGIVSKRRKAMEKGESKKDLLQIFLDAHDTNPNEYTMKHVYDEMRLFMSVIVFRCS
jgi:cytochrome P450